MPWLLTGDVSFCLEGHYLQTQIQMNQNLFMFFIQVCTSLVSRFIWRDTSIQNTERITFPDPDPNTVNLSEKATQLARDSSTSSSTQGRPQQLTFFPSDSDVHVDNATSPLQRATSEDLNHPASLRIGRERSRGSNDLPCMNDKPRRVSEGEADRKGSTDHHVELVAPDASSEKVVARLEHGRADLERQLSERNRHIVQLAEQLEQKSVLLEQADANAAEAKKHPGLEVRDLQAKPQRVDTVSWRSLAYSRVGSKRSAASNIPCRRYR